MEYESSMHKSIEEEISGAVYFDGGKWKGWSVAEDRSKYYFDDIGSDTIVGEFDSINNMEEYMKCNDCEEKATCEVDGMNFCDDCCEEYEAEDK